MKNLHESSVIAVGDCLGLKPGESLLLVTDGWAGEICKALEEAASALKVEFKIQRITETGGHGREPDPETADMMKKSAAVIIPARFSMTHTDATRNACRAGARVVTLPGIDEDIYADGLRASPALLHEDGDKWMRKLEGHHTMRLTDRLGSDFRFSIGRYRLINDDGCINAPGLFGNLPAGEVFTAPEIDSAEGVLISDGTIGDMPFLAGDEAAELHVAHGSICEFRGKRAESLKGILSPNGENAFKIAEFGIGTNPFLQMTGNLLGDEKIRGTVHFAFGNNVSMGGGNNVKIHIDCMMRHPNLFMDGKQIMEAGNLKLGCTQ